MSEPKTPDEFKGAYFLLRKCASDLSIGCARLQTERDELRKALAAAEQGRDELQAKLAAMEGQEPVAVVGSGYALYWQGSEPLSKLLERFDTVKVGSFLYAAAGAAPKEQS